MVMINVMLRMEMLRTSNLVLMMVVMVMSMVKVMLMMLIMMMNVMLRMEMLSTWLHTLKVRSRSHRASGRLSNGLNVKTSDTFRFHIMFILCRLF